MCLVYVAYVTIISGNYGGLQESYPETAVKVANTLVSSRLDYCKSLLYHTKTCIGRLQRLHNALCPTLCKVIKFNHMTPFLHNLHWLPMQYRILFKYNLVTYKAINFSQPPYLSSLILSRVILYGTMTSQFP